MSNFDDNDSLHKEGGFNRDFDVFNRASNRRKRNLYWVGFLKGALSSGRLEDGEMPALYAESEKFASFFNDSDAIDLAEDIKARCFDTEEEAREQIQTIIDDTWERFLEETQGVVEEKDSINEFLGFCAGVICDSVILEEEIRALHAEMQGTKTLRNSVMLRPLRLELEAVLEDGIVTDEEAKSVKDRIADLVGDGFADTQMPSIGSVACPDEPIRDPSEITFENAHFALTGPMDMGPRSFIVSEIDRQGSVYEGSVNNKCTYVVVSSTASRHWKSITFGAKMEKALALIAKGHAMRFVSEVALRSAIEMTDEYPGAFKARRNGFDPRSAPQAEKKEDSRTRVTLTCFSDDERKALKELADRNGRFRIMTGMAKSTELLVVGYEDLVSKKVDVARQNGIPVISGVQFQDLLERELDCSGK